LNGGNNGVELGGLATRVRIIADVRTNSVVILAQPNDLKEVEKVIQQLDRPDSSTVSEVKVFELRHAVAEDLASSLNQIIQATINPPQTAQGQNQFGGFGAFGGNQGGSTQLREVRSAMLEFLTADGNEKVRLRSGILADIRINSDARSNTVIITAPKESMDLVAKLVERLDKPASTVATIKYYPLKSADASSVQTVLNELFTSTTQQGNQGTNTQVGVQLAGAEEAASVVPLRFSVDVRSNSIVAVGTAEALEVVEALIYRLDDSGVQQRQTTVIRLKNTPADAVADALQTFVDSQLAVLQTQGQAQGQGSLISAFELADRQVIIQPELNTNTLLISASPRYFNDMLNLVKSLDEDLPQVVIQALLVEVTLEDTDEFGIEFGVQDSILFSRGVTGGVGNPGFNFNTTTVPLPNANTAGRENLAGQALSNLNVGRLNSDLGFGGLVLSAGSESVNVLLRALAARRKLEVLSRPQIRTLHNQEALIQVASEVPIVNGFSTGGISGNVPTVEYRQAGLVLQVVPKVGPDGKIQMQVAAQKTTLDRNGVVLQGGTATTGEVRSPIIDGTTAQSTVTVSDQQTVVLGGLITKSTENVTRKVPWLGDLPVIGHGFRFDRVSEKRTELLIFLTPHIVTDDGVNEMIKQVEAARLHWTECDAELIHGPIFAVPPEHVDAFEVPDNIPADTYPTFPQMQVNPPAPNPPAPNPPAPAVEEPVIQQMSGEQAAMRSPDNRVQTAGFATSSGRTGATSRNTLLPVRRKEEPASLRPVR
jgi:type II secretion system protein D